MLKNKKLNIAVLLSGINYEYQNVIINSIIEHADNNNIYLTVFECNGGISNNSEKYDIGEYNIFSLFNIELFDGVILLTNTMKQKNSINLILEKMKNARVPVVSIDNELDYAYFVGNESYYPIKNIVNHLVLNHKLTKINYVSGNLDNVEAMDRFCAYKDAMMENGLMFSEKQVYFGNFVRSDGLCAVIKFLEDNSELPEAIVCANDVMALGVYDELVKNGIKVPEDVCITGFDNTIDAKNNYVPITTVSRSLKEVGQTALQMLVDLNSGKYVEKRTVLPTEVVFSNSCGCTKTIDFTKKTYYHYYDLYSTMTTHLNESNRMSEDLTASVSFEEVFEQLKEYVVKINCNEFYVCICEDWARGEDSLDFVNLASFSQNYRIYGYSEKMKVALAYKNGEFLRLDSFSSKAIIPHINNKKPGSNYIISPLHFQDRCFGYCVIETCDFVLDKNILYHTWLMYISNALENIRKQNQLRILVNRLEKVSSSDPLTGIYNRHGFFKQAEALFLRNSEKTAIIYYDLDSLKNINDNFGHEKGDVAIKAVANAISKCCGKNEICARFGGDEFVILCFNYNEEKAENFCNNVQQRLNSYNSGYKNGFKVDASYGYYIFENEENGELSEYIKIADEKMYKNKHVKKMKQ